MWRKIKSIFILKKVFINVENKRKLNIIVHNKKIQKKLGLNIFDFIRFSGRYRVEESNRIKDYSLCENRLLFEGQYSNRNRNGFGKEFDEEGNIIFEGEYVDGKRWKGKAKEYDEDTGKLILESKFFLYFFIMYYYI